MADAGPLNIAARRLARLLLLAVLLAAAGCVFVATPFSNADNTLHQTTVRGEGDAEILWLPITGFISDSPSQHALGLVHQPSTLARVSQALDKAAADDDIAALVLRIDSPGGTVAAADEIYARIKRYHDKTDVPVLASFGGIAASGGYYVAMAAQSIIAQPTTVTGSIGVIIFGVNIQGLMKKLGIENQTFRSGKHKDILSPLDQATPQERDIIQRVVDTLFQRFVQVVKQNRPDLDQTQLARITDGRIFAADDAQRLGLVDEIGHIPDVIERARQAAGVDEARVIRYYRGRSAPETLVAHSAAGGIEASQARAAGLPVDLSRLTARGATPLYLWRAQSAR